MMVYSVKKQVTWDEMLSEENVRNTNIFREKCTEAGIWRSNNHQSGCAQSKLILGRLPCR
jgi:hypothetical protein